MSNRLTGEPSPYLRQHADNPVDWWPWCPEAFDTARRQGKPILLSVGYSACHWCHVMAHESFENAEIAERMNRLFVNIKVDREERPDLDQIYQAAHELLAQRSGGWPLTMFLDADGVPFFGGTYFPPSSRHGLPAFPDILDRVAEAFRTQRAAIDEQNGALRAALKQSSGGRTATHPSEFSDAPLTALRELLSSSFDELYGGFGRAPKFPHASDLEFLLRRAVLADDARARHMALSTLTHMAEGGIDDQLGGGFYRYSVDQRWAIPHFEKMLYDNGTLLARYADAWQMTGAPLYKRAAEGIADWVMCEMQAPEGGYYAALDADAAGEEGSYYVWDRDEVRDLLDADAYAVVERHYGLDGAPNFEGRAWHLVVVRRLEQVAEELAISFDEVAARLARAREELQAARARRIAPGVDDKILTGWNALVIAGMARGARIFGRADWLASARRALGCIREQLWRGDRLLAASDGKRGRLDAYLDDHAFLIDALIELMQTDFDPEDLAFADDLADVLLDSFEDRVAGGFFFTRHDHEALIMRSRPIHDNPTPSGNGMAARSLARLGHLTGETRYLDAAERTLRAFHSHLAERPGGCAALVMALEERLAPPAVVVLRGPRTEMDGWKSALARHFAPDAMLLFLPERLAGLPPVLDKPVTDRVNAWMCRGVECLSPVDNVDTLMQMLKKRVTSG